MTLPARHDGSVAMHFLMEPTALWHRLSELWAMAATGIVALPPDVLLL